MGWFENQIDERREKDQQLLEDSFISIAGIVMGRNKADRLASDLIVAKSAIDEILKYYHFKTVEIPDEIKSFRDQLDYALKPYGIMYRDIELSEGWYKDAYGPILGFTKEEELPVALLPGNVSGYSYNDPVTGKKISINERNSDLLKKEAVCFYRPLPLKKIGIPDLIMYLKRCINMNDIIMIVLATLAVTGVGLLIPRLTKVLTGTVLNSGRADVLISLAICLVAISISSQLFSSLRGLINKRLEIKTSVGVQASMMMRLMSLPPSFFRGYSPGELRSRISSVNELCTLLQGMVMSTGLSSLASLVYIGQIFSFAPALVIPSIIIILLTVGASTLTTLGSIRVNKLHLERSAVESGMSYSMISGIQKIKLAGAEKRIFAKWIHTYGKVADLECNPPFVVAFSSVINTGITLIANIVLYYIAVKSGIDQSSYFAFTAAYGAVMGAFSSLSGIALSTARIRPILEIAEPFLNAVPETSEGKAIVTDLRGSIELDHVSFRYSQDTPYILKDLSLNIKPGEYVAIVGKTGCGKSTLIRLLLGFEKPETGAVLYDGKDISGLDPGSLRRKIGCVLQDGGLFQGDIYSNIVITAPELDENAAWEAAEKAGIADDIRQMPMGMSTYVSERSGGLSGGQKQRIMIARAIAPKPKILIFDEATSALDNKTQRQVSEALDSMGVTRIVIAHRLSTIQHCDRILVLDEGRVIEEGTYDELIDKNGAFAELVERQRLNI